jgi:serine/threonine-protein kinase RsbW
MKAADHLTLRLKNDLAELESLTAGVGKFCDSHGLHPKNNFEVTLALEEIFTNIISYGFCDEKEHQVRIDMARVGEKIVIRVEDDGNPFDPTKAKGLDRRCTLEECRIGGLGLHLINRIMTRVKYERKEGRNILVLEKRLAAG